MQYWETTIQKPEYTKEELIEKIIEVRDVGGHITQFRKKYPKHAQYIKNNNLSKLYDDYKLRCTNGKMQGIYAYEFILDNGDKWVYVGLTNNFIRRDYDHRKLNSKRKSSVRDFSLEHNIPITKMKIVIDYEESIKASIDEGLVLKQYTDNGWNEINRIATGSCGGGEAHKDVLKIKSIDEVIKIIKDNNITLRTELERKFHKAYAWAKNNNMLDELLPRHWHTIKHEFTFEECVEDGRKYKTSKEWHEKSRMIFNYAARHAWHSKISVILDRDYLKRIKRK